MAPVRNVAIVCFERVTANSVCKAVPVRNAGERREIGASVVAEAPGITGRPGTGIAFP